MRRGYIFNQFLPCFRTTKLSDVPLVGAKLCRRRRQQQPDWATANLETAKQRATEETDATPVCCNNTRPCVCWPGHSLAATPPAMAPTQPAVVAWCNTALTKKLRLIYEWTFYSTLSTIAKCTNTQHNIDQAM